MFDESGKGPALVFLPGFSGDGRLFDTQVRHFSPKFRCLTWTVPGRRDTEKLDLVSVGSLTLQILAELDAFSIRQAHFVGQAIGGMVVQEFAIRFPDRVLSATLFATSPSLGDEFKKRFLAERLAPLDAGLVLADMTPALMTRAVSAHAAPEGVRAAVEALATTPPELYRKLIEAAAQYDGRDKLEKISAPVLCLAGEADRMAPPAMMEHMAEKIPNGSFAVLPRAGHEAQLEQPHAFNALLEAFLQDNKEKCT